MKLSVVTPSFSAFRYLGTQLEARVGAVVLVS